MSKSSSLKSTLYRVGVGSVLISALLISAISILVMLRFLPREVEARNEMVGQLVAQQCEAFLQDKQEDLLMLGGVLEESGPTTENHLYEKALLKSGSNFYEGMLHLDSNGRVLHAEGENIADNPVGLDVSGESYFSGVQKSNKVFWSPVFSSPLDSQLHTTLSVKVGSHVLVAFIGLDKLSKFFSGFSRREGVSLALVDRNGAFLYHSSQNLVEDRSNFLQFPELQAKARMGQKLVTIQLDGRSWDASLRPLALTGWSILLLSDPFVTYNSVFMLAISIMGITLLLLIILSLGSVNLFRRLLEPLDRFMSQIQKASHGTLEKMPEGENFEEFRVLGNHFNRMVQNIDDRQTQFVRANEKLNVELQENQKSNEAFQTIMRTLARATGDDLFRLISKTVSDWLRVDLVFVGELSPDGTAIVFRGALGGDFEQSSLSFAVADSLCERALLQGFFLQEGACWKDFYQSRELEMIRPEGFLGVSIRDAAGRNIGVLAVYSKSVLQVPRRASEVLRILADRCASEIQRMHQEVAFKRLNLELGDMARSLGVKNREMESMLYATSHDLKAPLVNISGFAKELNGTLDDFQKILQRERVSLPREATEILQTDVPHCVSYIQNGASRMDRLIAGLLKLFRVGRLQMEFKPVDLTALLSNIREEMRFSLTESKTEMEIGDLAHCVGDENQLAQVFQNLLSNSLKYQSPDRNLRITIRGRVVDRHVEIEFEDNGQGIPEKQKDRVFQLFFRAGNSQGVPGDGIGLAIVHRILDQHSGNISLESTEGVGTTFLIRLPVGK